MVEMQLLRTIMHELLKIKKTSTWQAKTSVLIVIFMFQPKNFKFLSYERGPNWLLKAGACAIFLKLYGENMKLPTMAIRFQMALRYNDGVSSSNIAR